MAGQVGPPLLSLLREGRRDVGEDESPRDREEPEQRYPGVAQGAGQRQLDAHELRRVPQGRE